MNEPQLGVLIHGAGWVAGEHINAYQANPHTRIVAISSRRMESVQQKVDEAGLSSIGMYTRLDEALKHEGVDIVSICTPQHLHAENAIQSANSGKHLLIEKPAATKLSDLRAMQQAISQAGVKTVVSFVLRWNPLFETLKSMSADGAFGSIYYGEVDYQSNIASWWGGFEETRKKEAGVSSMLVAGCHALDSLRWLVSPDPDRAARVSEVFAYSGGWRKECNREYNYLNGTWSNDKPALEFDGFELLMLKFENGAIGKVTANLDCIMPYQFPFSLFGDKGTVKNNRIWSQQFTGQTDWVDIPTILPDSTDVAHHPFQKQIDHLVDCILSDQESHCNLDDAAHTHEIIFAAQQCYETNNPVTLPLPL